MNIFGEAGRWAGEPVLKHQKSRKVEIRVKSVIQRQLCPSARDIPQILLLRHTNSRSCHVCPEKIRNFCVQKITDKKLMFFFEKVCQHLKSTIQLSPKLLRTYCSLKIRTEFDLKGFRNFVSSKKCIFCTFSEILKCHFSLNRLVLTKCLIKYVRSIRNLL